MHTNIPNLTLFAGVPEADECPTPYRIRMDSTLQSEIAALFQQQAREFRNDGDSNGEGADERVPFDPKSTYRLERGQIYVIRDIALPPRYIDAATKPHQCDNFAIQSGVRPHMVSIFAAESSHSGVNRVLFQQFRTPQILDRKLALFWSSGVFNRVDTDGISLANQLAAIWESGSLFFHSFSIASRLLDLSAFEPKATIEEITDFVQSSLFAFESDEDSTKVFKIIESDDFLRRRVASIHSRDVLSQIKPVTASKKAKEFGIAIDVEGRGATAKIALPVVKKDLKAVVKFLNEEYFHGELTDRLYETNSLRSHTAGG